ncbi:DUF1236 domain-containing protein [Methylocella sp.]|uniref:DUF1236 domain-containing protein n=1 Tax=Methylocella sp. TaxID=1978226 RepID=UPI0035AFF732
MNRRLGVAVLAALIAPVSAAKAQAPAPDAKARPGQVLTPESGPPRRPVEGAPAAGVLGADQAPAFRQRALQDHRSNAHVDRELAVGGRLPPAGITYLPIPPEFGVPPRYRYAVVNGQPVIVDPTTREIVQIVR